MRKTSTENDGILQQVDTKAPPAERTDSGDLVEGAIEKMMQASDDEIGPWYAVHHGYEVQICDEGGEFNRTGSVYSLSKSAPAPRVPADQWRTMIITLTGEKVRVEIDGKKISAFDSQDKNLPSDREWYEPKREPKRPTAGYIGLQNHDPGDVVYFREISVRPLQSP